MCQLCSSKLMRGLPKVPRLGGAGWWEARAAGHAEQHLPLWKVGKGASVDAATCATLRRHRIAIVMAVVISRRGEERKAEEKEDLWRSN